jgi:hypothetical protein
VGGLFPKINVFERLKERFSRKPEEIASVNENEIKLSPEDMKVIHPRWYFPKEDDTIYHYCSAETFLNITKYRTLRFSDIFSMNDFNEMHWGYDIFEQSASMLLEKIPKTYFDEIDGIVSGAKTRMLPLVCCFSLDGDVLSQWRAYGQDGSGYAIGFSARMLDNMPAKPLEVLYDKAQQIEEVSTWLKAIYEVERNNGFTYGDDFKNHVAMRALDLCGLKNPGFKEELEIRLAHILTFSDYGPSSKLVDYGGTSWGRKVSGLPVQFRMKGEIPVPYLDLDFSNDKQENPIKIVYLGPKNKARPSGVGVYLNTIGLDGVEIRKSETSYI